MKLIFLILVILCNHVLADQSYYDEQEKIRRFAEKIDQEDQRQREEAKKRYDRQELGLDENGHASTENSGMGILIIVGLLVGLPLYWYAKGKEQQKKQEEYDKAMEELMKNHKGKITFNEEAFKIWKK